VESRSRGKAGGKLGALLDARRLNTKDLASSHKHSKDKKIHSKPGNGTVIKNAKGPKQISKEQMEMFKKQGAEFEKNHKKIGQIKDEKQAGNHTGFIPLKKEQKEMAFKKKEGEFVYNKKPGKDEKKGDTGEKKEEVKHRMW